MVIDMLAIGENALSLKDMETLLFGDQKVEVSTLAIEKVRASFNFLEKFSANKVIYGINTGFGPMAQYKIEEGRQEELQKNLIRSHSSGSGKPIANQYVRALMIARLNTLMLGYSGVHENVIYLLKELINHEVYPLIFEHGGVGASGDLVQLAHLALTLLGEGEVSYNNEVVATKDVFAKLGLQPMAIYMREGLGLMNGTAAMTGIGLINIIRAKNLLNNVVMASCMLNEIVSSYNDHFSEGLNAAKRHKGQQKIASIMRHLLADSGVIRNREEHLYDKVIDEDIIKDKVQEYYSLRCVPQILGPVWDTLSNAEEVLIGEINSANDNPIIDVEAQTVYHGGNFHGDYVAYEMDKLKVGITKISMLCERQLNFLMNDKLNQILPPFINRGKLGFNFGMQGMQFTATSTVAENQTYSSPMYIHSIPNNNDNQDIVSMGTNAALITGKVIENSYEVLAIHFIGILQAIDYLAIENKMSSSTRRYYHKLNELLPKFEGDKVRYTEIKLMKDFLMDKPLDLDKI